jgi:uncharacterized RDD family membrane protein YckC
VTEPTPNLGMDDAPENDSWKNEVASRLDTYRSRSNRKLSGEFSMRFNFDGEPAPPRQQVCVPESISAPELPPELEVESFLVEEAEAQQSALEQLDGIMPGQADLPQTDPPAQPPPLRPSVPFKRKVVMEANVIEFPRLFPPEPQPPYALAEPIVPTMPRILDAPEIGQPLLETPMLDGMRLEHLERTPAPGLDLPMQVTPIVNRVYAAIADAIVVLMASGLFATIAYKMLDGLEWTKPLLGGVVLVPAVLWAIYQYLFIVYSGRTPGMAITRIALSSFQGTKPSRRLRRLRCLGIALSCSSLMLGFAWAFFDEDTLCWHDRISRTYLVQPKPE